MANHHIDFNSKWVFEEMKIYQVGGSIRDKYLKRPSQDRDWVVVGAKPEELLAQGFTQVGSDFPVFLHPTTREEYALARTERKIKPGYTGFHVEAAPNVSLEDDLRRRDLTINAMAEDRDGTLIDPFNGLADLQAKILRHVSPAFIEDPVRILRVARFAARLNFQVAQETLTLMKQMVEQGEVDALVAERVWQEMERALTEPYVEKFFEILRQCGALARIFPELDRLFGIPQSPQSHPEVDTGIHVMLALQEARQMTTDPQILFAVLTHDLGKGTTPDEYLPKHPGHEKAGISLVETVCQRYKVPKQFQEIALLVVYYHGACHQVIELAAEELLDMLEKLDAFRRPQRFEQFLQACEADFRGRWGFSGQNYPQANWLRQIFTIANQIKTTEIIAAGFQGIGIKTELQRQRIQTITQFLHQSA